MRLLIIILSLSTLTTFAQVNADEALAVQYFQQGEFDKAALMYEKLFVRTKNPAYYDPYFTSLLRIKRYDEAEDLARRMQKSNPDNFTYAVDVGRVLQERGEHEKSAEWYNKLIRELPANNFAIKDLAITFYRAEAYDYSTKTFLAGRKLLNDPHEFAYDLVSLYRYRKDKANLIQEYLNILDSNPGILQQAQNVLSSLLETKEDFDMLRSGLLRKLQKDPQNVALTEFLTWQYIQQKEFDMALRQTLALDRRLKEEGERVFQLSRVLLSNQAYDQTVQALDYLVAKGQEGRYYIPARIDLLNTKTRQLTANKFSTGQMVALENDYKALLTEFGTNAGTSFAVRQLANLQAFYLQRPGEAAQMMSDLIALPGVPPNILAQIKLELADIYILAGEVWESALLYGQVDKQFANEPNGQEARFKNARLAFYQGDFTWSKAQLDVLKSSTSQLIANDALNLSLLISDNLQNETDSAALVKYAQADLLIFKNEHAKAIAALDSLNILFPGNSLADDILMAKARIYLKNSETEQAVAQLQAILDNFGSDLWGDDALFMLADIYENKLSQPDRALELYQRIVTNFPGSLYVVEARKRFRFLRGDKLG